MIEKPALAKNFEKFVALFLKFSDTFQVLTFSRINDEITILLPNYN